MTERFVRDPRSVVKAGDVVTVTVMKLDAERKRIGFSMRLTDEPGQEPPYRTRGARVHKPKRPPHRDAGEEGDGALAEAFAKPGFRS